MSQEHPFDRCALIRLAEQQYDPSVVMIDSHRISSIPWPADSASPMTLQLAESLHSNLHELKSVTDADISMEIVINKWHPSLKHVKDNMGVLYTKYGSNLNDTIIPQFSGFARQMDPTNKMSCPLVESDPTSVGARAMIDVAKSMIRSFGISHPGLVMHREEGA
jgi:hypothetical protein